MDFNDYTLSSDVKKKKDTRRRYGDILWCFDSDTSVRGRTADSHLTNQITRDEALHKLKYFVHKLLIGHRRFLSHSIGRSTGTQDAQDWTYNPQSLKYNTMFVCIGQSFSKLDTFQSIFFIFYKSQFMLRECGTHFSRPFIVCTQGL